MNHIVFLDDSAGELEKILSGTKRMVLQEFDPASSTENAVKPGDSLYFLKSIEESTLRVKATVTRALSFTNNPGEDLSQTLKEMQPRLQLTENQYNYWISKKKLLLVEFDAACKIDVIRVVSNKVTGRSGWIAFEEFSQLI